MTRRLATVLLVGLLGCGDSGPVPLPPAPVAVVTLDGRPAAGLNLRLHAADGTPVGGGSTGPDGRTDLRGQGGQPVPPGTYKVVVVDLGDAEPNPMEATKAAPSQARVPAVYGKPTSTPLSVTLAAGKSEHPIEVKGR